ncbi:MAG: type II toxin-antitoxin system RelE/ParE family toxin [Pseudomonadota bacterium]
MRLEFHEEALAEYQAAALRYAEHTPELAIRFVEAVEQALQLVAESPSSWRVIEEDIHRCLTRIFPYGILYTVESDFILVLAVAHCSRQPGYWKSRQASA